MRLLLLLLSALAPLAQIITGPLSGVSNSDDANAYISTDASPCSPLYIKQNGKWSQAVSVGPSGALSCGNTSTVDINQAVVPLLSSANRFTGLNSFSQFQLTASQKPRPACTQDNRFTVRVENNGRAKDSVLICASSGSGMRWMAVALQ
jgi:hypothetical protein